MTSQNDTVKDVVTCPKCHRPGEVMPLSVSRGKYLIYFVDHNNDKPFLCPVGKVRPT